ncbi:carbohydrate ABC transporter permease [Cohnella lupini]|uniref:Carbohydrate ABC transporter membrane protein 2 (CUT1 family) n=1 Tax=Cohnella lupini TaxID=1294267 RepID=A0A3D9I1W5_9BACL|nr:carbohydrate ABC transporter permease [Cohnella lupini]RED55146.1 carbohydrate ABC transporter membrane protein 2 (CUT1 family) [Cohnella lupini]
MKPQSMSNLFRYFLLSLSAAIILVPFYWMINTSLKTNAEILRIPPTLFPSEFRFQNFADAIVKAPILTYLLNTVVVALSVVAISTVVSVLAAFAFARLNFRGKQILFIVILGTMMVPQEMLIITNFMTIADLGWMNTWQALIAPYCINAFNIYLLRQTFKQVPDELYLASKVDGVSNFRFLRKIMLPLSKSTIVTVMILSVIWIWDTYAWPSLVTTKDSMRLVSNGLQNAFTNDSGRIQYEIQMAASTLVILPLVFLFLMLKKYIISGMVKGGIKG